MATQILIKKSTTPGSIPLTGDLAQGELAVNLADRKLYTNNGSAIVRLDGTYINSTAPASPVEGDLWYDTTNDVLKTYDGSTWASSGASLLSALGDVTITGTPADDELLAWDSVEGEWINQTAAQAGLSEVGHTHAAGDITSGTLDNARVHETNVTQHQAALSITESQISDLGSYLTAEADTLDTVTGRGATTTNGISVATVTTTGNVIVGGDLTVNGTTTQVNTTEVNIGDNIIVLNHDEAGTPSQNAGFEIERGTSANVSFLWDETADAWSLGDETLQDVVLDGGTY